MRLQLHWQHTEQELYHAYHHARHPQLAQRLHALWRLRCGDTEAPVAHLLGVHLRTVQRWVAWYRQGKLTALQQRTHGGARRQATSLTAVQQAALRDYAATHGLRTQAEAQAWVQEQFGIRLTPKQVRGWFQRLGLWRKVPPVERVFLAVRCWVEGVVYGGDIEAKVRAVEAVLQALALDAARVRSLVGWDWLVEALEGGNGGGYGT